MMGGGVIAPSPGPLGKQGSANQQTQEGQGL